MKKFILTFFSMLIFLSPFFLRGQQAKRGNLTAKDMVVTNEVDPMAEYHWDAHSGITWKITLSNGYIHVQAYTNVNIVTGRR